MTIHPSTGEHSRRSFLKTTALLTLGSATIGQSLAAVLTGKGGVALVVAPDDAVASAVPPTWALGELKAGLEKQGATVRVVARIADAQATEFCVLAGGVNSPAAQTILRQRKISAPTEAESLCLVQGAVDGRPVLLAAGADCADSFTH